MTAVRRRTARSQIFVGDCLDVLPTLDAESVDALVTDPPYGLSLMGESWDRNVPGPRYWTELLRVAKPGAHLMAFGGARTFHRLTCAIEDGGWQIRDTIMWVYGSGFPKSHNVGRAIVERHQQSSWDGWGTALKPAWEPIVLARKAVSGTIADNLLTHGTGGLNIDDCRIPHQDSINMDPQRGIGPTSPGWDRPWKHNKQALQKRTRAAEEALAKANTIGRFPANLIHDGSDEVLDQLGSAARLFYCSKASKRDRDEGLANHEHPERPRESFYRAHRRSEGDQHQRADSSIRWSRDGSLHPIPRGRNTHPTVKPTPLMRYLCRLITPPGGIILDPFMGSGSTGKAAIFEGFRFVGIELNPEYAAIAASRIKHIRTSHSSKEPR